MVLRASLERGMRDARTIAKVVAMPTDAFEGELRCVGVRHTREDFLALTAIRDGPVARPREDVSVARTQAR